MAGRATLALILLSCLCPPPGALAQEPSALQEVLHRMRAELDLPGTVAAVILPDGTLWEGASGVSSPGIEATPATAFELGSITKTYTAALLLRLAEAGEIDLGDTLAGWYPELPGAEAITVEQLLNHTHGLHDPIQEADYVPSVLQEPARAWTLEDVLVRMQEPHFEPGAGWRYSNTGFHLAGAIAERVAGMTFGALLEHRILGPHGLSDTWYGHEDPAGTTIAAAYIDPSGSGSPQPVSLFMPWTAFRTSGGPAGAVVATASDAARWLHALATGKVLGEAEWERMTTWVERPDGYHYGLGLLRIEAEGRPLLGHKGNSAGYSASAFHDPAAGITVAVLSNGHAVDVTPVALKLLCSAALP